MASSFKRPSRLRGSVGLIFQGRAGVMKGNLQAGLGFIHADYMAGDTSWVIPIGAGVDYLMTSTMALTGTFLLNFADLHTGQGSGHVMMPAVTVGIRF